MQQICRNPWCKQSFEITEDDLALLDMVSPVIGGEKSPLPPPTLCQECRQQRRLIYRNERVFYRRPCNKTWKDVISIYSAEKPCTVYDQTVWWSDDWDQLATGRAFDETQPFFRQFYELSMAAPRPCIMNMGSENSEYTHHAPYNKNCYMCINSGYNQDCFYVTSFSVHNKDCADCLAIQHCERCVECVDCKQCTSSTHLLECENCADCSFCYDCQSCSNCFGCWNLRHTQFCFQNTQLTKTEYQRKLQSINVTSWNQLDACQRSFTQSIEQQAIHRGTLMKQSEHCSGDHIVQCKDVRDSYYMFDCQQCAHCYDCGDTKSSMDALEPYHGELQYETHGCNLGYNLSVCSKSYECNNVHLSEYCFSCSNCFGCFGLRKKQYCILNKQYTKEEYEKLVPRIIEHMKKTDEWGEFFPANLSPFAYNETVAQEYFPLTKEEVLKRGWTWKEQKDELPQVTRTIPANKLPVNIADIPDDVLNWAIECEATKRPFKIIKQELDFYRTMRLPIPRLHPDDRHRKRMAMRNPRKLWKRPCMKCGKDIETTYAPERPEIVYCEECYLKEVY
ncbi:hypothetical protein AUJ46_05560 [Candidatus Peregrinibacteria bacterium CG1_02_54_53]|nr:MAG: hypothetical protein AUJ46_05560 [Candidatus Peregrinibacteria bacterium CG1_02_54_53]